MHIVKREKSMLKFEGISIIDSPQQRVHGMKTVTRTRAQ